MKGNAMIQDTTRLEIALRTALGLATYLAFLAASLELVRLV